MLATEENMVKEIAALGYPMPAINSLHHSKTPLPADIVAVILKWLPDIYAEHVGAGEHLIRALITTEQPFDPGVIIDLFENSNYNETLKCTMSYVLSISKVNNISAYIRDQLYNKPVTFKRAGFLDGLDKNAAFTSKDELMTAIKTIFDKYSFFEDVFLLFKKYGRKEDIPFLEERLDKYDAKKVKQIRKLIDGIENRKRENKFPK